MIDSRIRLRAIEPEDLEIFYGIENDIESWATTNTNVPYSKYLLQQYIFTSQHDIYIDKQVRFMVIHQATSKVIGMVDLVDFSPQHLRAEVGLYILPQYRYCGYGKEALKLIQHYAKEILHLKQIYAYINTKNTPSILCFGAAGFKQTALLRQWFFHNESNNDAHIMQFFL